MWYIGNAFSLSMLSGDGMIRCQKATVEQVKLWLSRVPYVSYMGHADVARVVSNQLGVDVSVNRINVVLKAGDNVVVTQYVGPRLPEGTTRLPDGARIDYYLVAVPVQTQEVADFEFDENSEYGTMLRKAEQVAAVVGGKVVVKQDEYRNYYFEVEGRGFSASLWEE
jgi:hypothetical protein